MAEHDPMGEAATCPDCDSTTRWYPQAGQRQPKLCGWCGWPLDWPTAKVEPVPRAEPRQDAAPDPVERVFRKG